MIRYWMVKFALILASNYQKMIDEPFCVFCPMCGKANDPPTIPKDIQPDDSAKTLKS